MKVTEYLVKDDMMTYNAYVVSSPNVGLCEILRWCEDHFGPQSITTWNRTSRNCFNFYNIDMAFEFKMRWY